MQCGATSQIPILASPANSHIIVHIHIILTEVEEEERRQGGGVEEEHLLELFNCHSLKCLILLSHRHRSLPAAPRMELGPVRGIRDARVVARVTGPLSAPRMELDLLAHHLLVLTALMYKLPIHVHLGGLLLLQLLPTAPLHPFHEGLLQQRLVDVRQQRVQGLVHVYADPVD